MKFRYMTALSTLAFWVMAISNASADTITKPNTFSAGNPAVAADVNANFDTVYDQVNKMGGEITVDDVNGRVGIGTPTPAAKLDVQGGVKVGDMATCDATTEGTLRYNSGEMEYCNGTTWKSLEPKTPIIWSGGCRSHGRTDGWNAYCADGSDFNTAADYVDVNTNGTFTFSKSGYFRINFFAISYSFIQGGDASLQFLKNGQSIAYALVQADQANYWFLSSMDQTLPFNIGDTLQVQVFTTSSGYAFHSWNSQGRHSRLQISYEGPLN